ncbi:MAG: extracellular solute-binding protein [Anaerolineae bacterium]|nr:extracellular solute-binding protein [Anaerolineae bacterium]
MKKLALLAVALLVGMGVFPLRPALQPSQAQDPVEITMVHIFPSEDDVRVDTLEALATAFEAETGVRVNLQSTTDDYQEVFNNALNAAEQGEAPQVVQVEDTLVQLAIDSQLFVKIGDLATEEQLATIPDLLPAVRNYYNLDVEIWGMPWNASNPIMYYNPTIFEAAGLDPNTPPTTFDELLASCEAIMAANVDGLQACVNFPVTSWIVEQWVSMQGDLLVNNENGRGAERPTEVLLTDESVVRIFDWWKTLDDAGYFTYSGTPAAYTPEGITFINRQTAIHISTSAALSNIFNFAPILGRFTPMVAPLPKPTAEADNGVTVGGGSLWVLDDGTHTDEEIRAAIDWIFFLTNTENDKAWHKASGYFPIRQSSVEALTAEGWFEENPAFLIPCCNSTRMTLMQPTAVLAWARMARCVIPWWPPFNPSLTRASRLKMRWRLPRCRRMPLLPNTTPSSASRCALWPK